MIGAISLLLAALVHCDGAFQPLANFSRPYNELIDGSLSELADGDWVSARCRQDSFSYLIGLENGDFWALKMLDSTGKPSSGIFEGGLAFPGFYSECLSSKSPNFTGQYCLVSFKLNGSHHQDIPPRSWSALTNGIPQVGLCVPSSCTTDDVKHAVSKATLSLFWNSNITIEGCHKPGNGYSHDTAAICITVILLICICLAVAGTLYEVIPSALQTLKSDQNIPTVSTEMLCESVPLKNGSDNVLKKVLLAFSMVSNGKKILSTKSGKDSIRVLHGMRFLSMVMIIFGHSYSFGTQWIFFRNPALAQAAPKGFIAQTFANGTLAVDTFFFISGLLVALVTLKMLEKTEGKLNIPAFIIHRYTRVTPLMMSVIAFTACILRYLGDGPNWHKSILLFDDNCRKNWWLNALYLNNFINTPEMCLSHTWYLATDFQFYLVSPLILVPLYKSFIWGSIVFSAFFVATTVTTAVLTAVNDYPAIPYINNAVAEDVVNEYYKEVYMKPYCRMGPYLVGIALGYIIFVTKGSITMKKWKVAAGWSTSVIANLVVLYSMWPANEGNLPTTAGASIYSATARSVWAIGLAWLTFACISGYGGFINTILSWKGMIPASHLTYCAYLIHPVIMSIVYGTIEGSLDFSSSILIYLFFGNLLTTYLVSFFLSLIFESPYMVLDRIILKRG